MCLLEATAAQAHLGTSTGAWIQIFNVNGNHWITATNIRSPPNTVSIYDSLWSKEASDRLKVWSTVKIRGTRVPQKAIVSVGTPRPYSIIILNMRFIPKASLRASSQITASSYILE